MCAKKWRVLCINSLLDKIDHFDFQIKLDYLSSTPDNITIDKNYVNISLPEVNRKIEKSITYLGVGSFEESHDRRRGCVITHA